MGNKPLKPPVVCKLDFLKKTVYLQQHAISFCIAFLFFAQILVSRKKKYIYIYN